MNQFQELINSHLPIKRKNTPSGWISFNAVCCHHNGEKLDKRGRGGIMILANGGWRYHCFNCNFKAGWVPGHNLTKNTKSVMSWLGIADNDINQITLEVLKIKDSLSAEKISVPDLDFQEKTLPDNCHNIQYWIDNNCEDENFLNVIAYLLDRGFELDWYDWHWSTDPSYKQRLLIPFYHNNKCVGWSARHIVQGHKPKYLSHSQPGYVFNIDRQTLDKHFVIVVEGPFDAIAIDGVAITHNEPNERQIAAINKLNKEVIVVPDRDLAGTKMIDCAIEQNWSISVPPYWNKNIKDVADAVKSYGRIYTLTSILNYRENNHLKMQLTKKTIEKEYGK